ncbi:hypothetical protein BDB00DRAFT_925191 [Zychaea mexicana]|uniref:uncharacterized protein n=1 Tax=Zychaea mexicana TaxID=64656 RepID=UPI0022FED2D5|nr:uncharacterized protein BDB00DRAFT_925191 [Zychaea mexicana]KAI9498402.1 hypothetical protein BDB00DRAFT_925191 [Zychaea mexicana]
MACSRCCPTQSTSQRRTDGIVTTHDPHMDSVTKLPSLASLEDTLHVNQSEALQARNLATAVHESTSALDRVHIYLEQFLAVRVEAYAQQGKVVKVYSDAVFFVDNFPGYLRANVIATRILIDTLFYLSNEAHHMLEKRMDMMLTVILNELSFESCELRTEYNGGVDLAWHLDACYVLNNTRPPTIVMTTSSSRSLTHVTTQAQQQNNERYQQQDRFTTPNVLPFEVWRTILEYITPSQLLTLTQVSTAPMESMETNISKVRETAGDFEAIVTRLLQQHQNQPT